MWWVKIYARRWLGKYMGQIPEERAQSYMNRNRIIYFISSSLFLASMWANTNTTKTKDDNKNEDLAEYASMLSSNSQRKATVLNFSWGGDTYERYEINQKEFSQFLKEKELIRKDTQGKILATIDHPDLDEELIESLN